jgi:ABC-2 type transport system permease protein
VVAIFRRELAGYFGQPLAYVVLGIFVLLIALPTLLVQDVLSAGTANMRVPFFWIGVAFLFLVPALTMRLIAEERQKGSLEMLVTLPVTPTQIVLGKWLAAVAMVGFALVLTATWPVALGTFGTLDAGAVAAGYLGMLLLGAAFAAVGVFASSVTQFQVVAFLLSFGALAVPFALGYALNAVDVSWLSFVQYLTFEYHFANLARGVLDTRSLVFFGGIIAVGLRGAAWTLENRRLA